MICNIGVFLSQGNLFFFRRHEQPFQETEGAVFFYKKAVVEGIHHENENGSIMVIFTLARRRRFYFYGGREGLPAPRIPDPSLCLSLTLFISGQQWYNFHKLILFDSISVSQIFFLMFAYNIIDTGAVPN